MMSMHNTPLTDFEREGLEKHLLALEYPSQLADVFRQGMAWALSKPQPTPSQSELLAEYDAVLRALCSYLSAGGYNDEADQLINPKVADEKIRWGIDQLLKDNQPQSTSQDAMKEGK